MTQAQAARPKRFVHCVYYYSKEGRYHTGNHLFIILRHPTQPELTWQLRRDFESLEKLVGAFLNAPVLLGLIVTNQHAQQIYRLWTAVIFYVKPT